MKKIFSIFFLLAAAAFVACSDDDDSGSNDGGDGDNMKDITSLTVVDLLGTYAHTASTEEGFVKCQDRDNIMRITGDQNGNMSNLGVISYPRTDEATGCANGTGSFAFSFELEEGVMTGDIASFKILSFDGTNLKWEITDPQAPLDKYTEDYVKQ